MVSIVEVTPFEDGKPLIVAIGLTADTKPTENIANGSMFIEMASGGAKVYLFDEENTAWVEA